MDIADRRTHQAIEVDSAHQLADTNATQPARDSNYCILPLKPYGKVDLLD